jgi:peptidoglycan/LPS O-acetylase OafA/YrhL
MNGLRGIAALAVVVYHCSLREPMQLHYGYLAVDGHVFFRRLPC